MGNKDKRVARIWKAIDEILWKDWDPIGVNNSQEARDEYHSYIGGAFRLLEDRADENQIAMHLHQIETEHMGICPCGYRQGWNATIIERSRIQLAGIWY